MPTTLPSAPGDHSASSVGEYAEDSQPRQATVREDVQTNIGGPGLRNRSESDGAYPDAASCAATVRSTPPPTSARSEHPHLDCFRGSTRCRSRRNSARLHLRVVLAPSRFRCRGAWRSPTRHPSKQRVRETGCSAVSCRTCWSNRSRGHRFRVLRGPTARHRGNAGPGRASP